MAGGEQERFAAGLIESAQQRCLRLQGVHLAENRLHDRLAAGIDHMALLGCKLARHALLVCGLVRDSATRCDRRRVVAAAAPSGDEKLDAMLSGEVGGAVEIVGGAVAGVRE